MANEYLTDFKTYLEFTLDDIEHDSILDMLLGAAQGFISSLYNVQTSTETSSLVVNGTGKEYLYLGVSPITSITTLTVDDALLDVSDYYFVGNEVYYIDGIFTKAGRNVTMDVTYGYTVSTVPDDLKFALFKIAEKTYYDATQNREGISTLSNDIKQRASFYNDIPEIATTILNTYKVYNIR